jgi:hypothetical protein
MEPHFANGTRAPLTDIDPRTGRIIEPWSAAYGRWVIERIGIPTVLLTLACFALYQMQQQWRADTATNNRQIIERLDRLEASQQAMRSAFVEETARSRAVLQEISIRLSRR